MSTRTRTARISSVEPLGGFVLRLGFNDGTVREVDLEAELWGPVFEPLRREPHGARGRTSQPAQARRTGGGSTSSSKSSRSSSASM
jgi:hypothetical protein